MDELEKEKWLESQKRSRIESRFHPESTLISEMCGFDKKMVTESQVAVAPNSQRLLFTGEALNGGSGKQFSALWCPGELRFLSHIRETGGQVLSLIGRGD